MFVALWSTKSSRVLKKVEKAYGPDGDWVPVVPERLPLL